jgi:two-component system sensor histidine kinase/response regulator
MPRRAKILIVDDSQLSLDILQAKLVERYDVVSTTEPGDALALARETWPDLIICDFDMPDMDGADVSDALRADAELRNIPLLFLTALVTTADRDRVKKESGGRPAIAKDSPREQITEKVEAMLKAGEAWRL